MPGLALSLAAPPYVSPLPKVPASVSCDSPCHTVTLDPYPSDPSKHLSKNTNHEATITTGVKDVSGNALSTKKTWTFTTGST
jgi:hypothetical protein